MDEQLNLVLLEVEENMDEVLEHLKKELSNIRTGRANPAILDGIKISYYGVDTPLNQIAGISVVEGTQLLIRPFDKSTVKEIEKAIYSSDIGITPQVDNQGVRLILPQLTGERRKEISRDVDKIGEEHKVLVRNKRRDGNDLVKQLELPEDLEKRTLDDVQKLTDKSTKEIDELVKDKIKEVETI